MAARVEFDGEARARAAYANGRGVVFVTGHFGYWELQALVHAVRMAPVAVLGRALDNPYLNRLLETIRQRTGNTVIYRRRTIRGVLRTLQAGRGVAVLIDQHIMSHDAIYVDFFEQPAATTSMVAALALRTGAAVVPVFALPGGPGRYRMVYEPPIEPPRGTGAEAIRELTQRTCGATPSCGCGCIAGGVQPLPPRRRLAACFRRPIATRSRRRETAADSRAELAGRCDSRAAGDRGHPPRAPRDGDPRGGAAGDCAALCAGLRRGSHDDSRRDRGTPISSEATGRRTVRCRVAAAQFDAHRVVGGRRRDS